MNENKKSQVLTIMSRVFNVSLDELGDNPSIESVKNWDSLKHMYLIVAIEEEINISFTEDQVGRIACLMDICKILEIS